MARKLGKGLNEDTHFIKRGKFEMETAKMYIVFSLAVFHILPLVFVFMGDYGVSALINMVLTVLNGIFIAAIGLFYGIRIGFNFKFPALVTVIAMLSYLFYYSDGRIFEDIYYYIGTGVIYLIVYAIFAFAATAVGGFLKRYI